MLGLDAYGSSSDDDDTVTDPPSARTAANRAETTRDAPEPSAPPAKPLFGNLPRPGVAKRVVRIPAPALRAALEDDSESDSEDGRAVKRARAAVVGGRGGSLAAALPKPKLAGSTGSGRGAALDLDRPSMRVDRASGDALEANETDEEEEELSEEEAGPHAADAYAVGDDGEYLHQEAFAHVGGGALDGETDDASVDLADGDSFVDRALAAAQKLERERHGREIRIQTISAADVRKAGRGVRASIMPVEGAFTNIHTVAGSSTARSKHQITSLLHDAKMAEQRILETGAKLKETRAAARQKYGW